MGSIGTVVSGTATISGTQIYFDPDDYTQSYVATFEYTSSDGLAESSWATVTVTVTCDDDPPRVGDPVPDFQAPPNVGMEWPLPKGALVVEVDENTSWSATLCDGSPLPDWLAFDPDTQTFTGTPPVSANHQTFCIRVTAADGEGFESIQFNLEVFEALHEATLMVGPDPFCPGWFQYYTLAFTNTDTIDITDLVITQTVPSWASNAWIDATSEVAGEYDVDAQIITMTLGLLEAGQSIDAKTVLHSYSQSSGEVVSEMVFLANEIADAKSRVITSTASLDICDATATPSPTPSPTPPEYVVKLPLVIK